MARRTFSFTRKARPIVFVRMHVEGDRLTLDARCYPAQLASIFLFVSMACAMARSAAPILLFGFFSLFTYFSQRKAARALFDAVEAEVASRVRRLAAETARVRIGDAPAERHALDVEERATSGEEARRRAG